MEFIYKLRKVIRLSLTTPENIKTLNNNKLFEIITVLHRFLNLLLMECCRYLILRLNNYWSSLKLFSHIHGCIFIFTVT